MFYTGFTLLITTMKAESALQAEKPPLTQFKPDQLQNMPLLPLTFLTVLLRTCLPLHVGFPSLIQKPSPSPLLLMPLHCLIRSSILQMIITQYVTLSLKFQRWQQLQVIYLEKQARTLLEEYCDSVKLWMHQIEVHCEWFASAMHCLISCKDHSSIVFIFPPFFLVPENGLPCFHWHATRVTVEYVWMSHQVPHWGYQIPRVV